MATINILNDYNEYPGLRNCNVSDFSGEDFYHKKLNKAFKKAYDSNDKLTIDLDNTGGFASSFLDEAFGNLVYDFTLAEVKKRVVIISDDEPHWKKMIEEKSYEQWEQRRKNDDVPIVSELHEDWYRLVDGKMILNQWEKPA